MSATTIPPADYEEIEAFLHKIGLSAAHREVAIECCRRNLIFTLGDLEVVASEPEDLRELFPQLGIRTPVKKWFKKEQAKKLGTSLNNNTNTVPSEVKYKEETGGVLINATHPPDQPFMDAGSTQTTGEDINASEASTMTNHGELLSQGEVEPVKHAATTPSILERSNEHHHQEEKEQDHEQEVQKSPDVAPQQLQPELEEEENKMLAEKIAPPNAPDAATPPPTAAISALETATSPPPPPLEEVTAPAPKNDMDLKELRKNFRCTLDKMALNMLVDYHGLCFTDKLVPDDLDFEDLENADILSHESNFQKFLRAVAADITEHTEYKGFHSNLALLQKYMGEWIEYLCKIKPRKVPTAPRINHNNHHHIHSKNSNKRASSSSSKGRDPVAGRREFEEAKKAILENLPEQNKGLFNHIGFAKWPRMSARPVMVVNPYDVPPASVREEWTKLYNSVRGWLKCFLARLVDSCWSRRVAKGLTVVMLS